MPVFEQREYLERIAKTKKKMAENGIEVLLITNPANMNYLSGYDGWSFYVDQMLVLIIDEEQPLWIGRKMDAAGARATTWIYHENIISYPDIFVHSRERHPMDFVAEILKQIGQSQRHIGVEMESYYFTALVWERLKAGLPNATFHDASLLVNEVRMIKSEREIEYMRQAARIVEKAMRTGITAIQEGVRQCDVVAKIYHDLISGTEEAGGDYPAIVPLLPSGENTSTPHLTWTDALYQKGELVILELAGCCKRYHAPMARTVSIGQPEEKMIDLSKIVIEGLNNALYAVRPGVTCEEVEEAWRKTIERYGIEKESRIGYSMGLSYPPDWGEHTASLRRGDRTILQPNMTFHMIPGIWFDDHGIEISESFRVTETGCEVLTRFPQDLVIKTPFNVVDDIS